MAINADDLHMATQTLTDGLHEALTGSQNRVEYNSEHQEYQSVSGAMFAIASAIDRLASAVEGLQLKK